MDELLSSLRETVADRYAIERELGRGGMAAVYLARDLKHARAVAVKVLPPDLGSLLGRERFEREIAIAAGLQHPNIIPLFDSGVAGGLLYYVMPYIEGESLRDRIERETQLPLEDALQIACEVADALSYAHSRGIVHRDIKPSNIMLSGGHALVADFGIARAIAEAGGPQLTERGLAIGTPQYMSPEQAGGEPKIDGRTDVYALGCVLFEMLAGEPPFTGRTAQAILARHLQERPPSLEIVRPTVPQNVCSAIETALAKVPADRFQTASRFTAALMTTTERRVIEDRRERAAVRRRRGLWVVAGATVVGLAGWRLAVTRSPELDAQKVVVFPLAVQGGTLGREEGLAVALLIGNAFEQAAPLKWMDGWRVLEPEQRLDIATLSARQARAIARAEGARYYVDGNVVLTGDSLTVILRLADVAADSVVSRGSASGPRASASAPQLGLRVVTSLLPALVGPSRYVDLSYLLDRSPAAVADWLRGEQEYRRSQFTAAMAHYIRALAADSAMTVAALKGALAATWMLRFGDAETLVRLALRAEPSLPARNRLFARALQHLVTGEADSAVAGFRRAIAIDPGWSEAWSALAETYHHLMPGGTSLDSLAEAAFAEATRLDPEFGPALFHLAEYALRAGDAARGSRLVTRFRRVSPDTSWVEQLELMLACLRDPRSIDWTREARDHPQPLLDLARLYAAGVRRPDCALSAFDALLATDSLSLADRWSAIQGRHHLDVAMQQPERAVALADSAVHGGVRAEALIILDAVLGLVPAERAAGVLAPFDGPVNRMPGTVLWWFGYAASLDRNVARLDSIQRALQRIADSTGRAQDRVPATAMAGRLALLRGDTARAIEWFGALRPHAPISQIAWRWREAVPDERMLLAELLLARGRAVEAIGVAEDFDRAQAVVQVAYVPKSLDIRARAATQLGQRARGDQYRARLNAMRARSASSILPPTGG